MKSLPRFMHLPIIFVNTLRKVKQYYDRPKSSDRLLPFHLPDSIPTYPKTPSIFLCPEVPAMKIFPSYNSYYKQNTRPHHHRHTYSRCSDSRRIHIQTTEPSHEMKHPEVHWPMYPSERRAFRDEESLRFYEAPAFLQQIPTAICFFSLNSNSAMKHHYPDTRHYYCPSDCFQTRLRHKLMVFPAGKYSKSRHSLAAAV